MIMRFVYVEGPSERVNVEISMGMRRFFRSVDRSSYAAKSALYRP